MNLKVQLRVAAVVMFAVGILSAGMTRAADGAVPELQQGLVLHLPLDGDCRDASGRGGDAVNHGASFLSDGRIGGAADYDGGDDYLALPGAATHELKQFTLALWVKTRQAVAAPRTQFWKNPTVLGAASSGPGSADVAVMLEDGKPGYHHGLEPQQDVFLFSARTIHDRQWHHLALSRVGLPQPEHLDRHDRVSLPQPCGAAAVPRRRRQADGGNRVRHAAASLPERCGHVAGGDHTIGAGLDQGQSLPRRTAVRPQTG